MASYQSYLILLTQLLHAQQAKILLDGQEIFISALSKKYWQVSTKVFNCCDSKYLKDFQKHDLDTRGSHLKWDPSSNGIMMVHTTAPLSKFSLFRNKIESFIKDSQEWRALFSDAK